MKLETFFEKFEQFADAPNAVAKMRELVLRLACSGRIANQDTADQTATELLSEIFKARNQFIKEGKGKSRVEGSMITAGDTMEIPATWTRCMISEVCDLQTGATPSRQVSTYFGGEIPWLVSGDINRGEILECDGRITEAGHRNSNCKVIPSNSVLIALNGQGKTRATVALLRIEATLNQSLVAMIPYSPERLLPEYLFWNLRGRYYAIRDITGQDQRRGLNMKLVGQLSLPLPPFAEQKRIVAKVDELMALCDQLEAQQQERDTRHAALARASLARFAEAPTPANLDFLFHNAYTITPADLRKSILTLAVQGKLVPQAPNDQPAAEMMAKIETEKKRLSDRGELKADKKDWVGSSTNPPHDIPETWCWIRLQDVFEISRGGSPRPAGDPRFFGGSIPWITVGEVTKGTSKYLTETTSGLTEEGAARSRFINPGDLLLTNSGATLGVPRISRIRGCMNDGVAVLRLFHSFNLNDFAYLYLVHQTSAFRSVNQGMGQPNLNTPIIAGWFFPLPPLAEQRRIVAKVDQLMALVDQLESQLTEAKSRSAALLEAIVHELLNPSAEVIDLASYRAAIGCYTISKMSQQPYFGRTAAMKTLYLAEAHVGVNLGFQPEREAAGPLDHWIYRFEKEGKQKEWFKVIDNTSNGKMKVEYQPGKMLAAQAAQAERQLAQDQRKEFDRLLDLLSGKKTEEVEIIATLFAAWNDFLIDGHAPSDDEIVTEVRENWHVKKERFTPAQLRQWLGWLRQNSLVPQGRLPHTVHQSKLALS